jgi:eukaryotic-like serine/threonine-protein kinase
VRIYDFGSDQVAYLIMEYVEGEPLSKTLNRVGRLTPARTMSLIAQAAEALQAAHDKGIVHRDVKPGNLLVRPNGTLVLTDFGIARAAAAAQLTATGAVLGTASYIAPEQASGSPATALSDVYSLGIVAYQCLSGHRPFEGDTPLEIAMKHVTGTARPLPEDVPKPIRQVVERAMGKEPRGRWESAEAFAVAARHAASGTVPAQRPVVNVGRPMATATPPYKPGAATVPPYKPGAAAVPPPVPATVNLTYRQQPVTTAPTTGGGRAALIVVWVVLAVLTLVVCSYLGYKTRQSQSQNRTGGTPHSPVLSVAQSRPEMMFQMTEGRLTR